MIVSAITEELHPMVNASLRFAESAIGTGIAVLVAYVFLPKRMCKGYHEGTQRTN
jgi:uncharacterized membrane protein YgaE (UPF0421/DUF939 family)